MYIERVPNRNSPPAILLRESYRDGKKVHKRTLANLTRWPPALVEGLRQLLRGATARGLDEETLFSSLGELLELPPVDEDELYGALDWLLERQAGVENALARRHLQEGTLVLYDVTSTYFEGKTCPLAHFGYPRDGKRGKLQIVFGLLCNREGCPVAVHVFDGNTADPKTLPTQIKCLRERFKLQRVVLVGDRGMITEARIREDLKDQPGLDWISALRAPAIRALVEAGTLQLSLFDQRDLAEITSAHYPGERLMVCKNPLLAEQRKRRREELVHATEQALETIVTATQRPRRRLKGKDKIALRVGQVINRYKVAKHFTLAITDEGFSYQRNSQRMAQEAALDGLYVIRTSVAPPLLDATQTVKAYKALSSVEQAFRSFKSVDLKVRPIGHRLAKRVRAHVFLCMLAYYVEWHMRQALAPRLFDDDDKAGAEALRESVVAPAQPSPRARHKASSKRTAEGHRVHSFQTLLLDLATIVKNRIQPKLPGAPPFDKTTRPTALQQRALDLLGVRL